MIIELYVRMYIRTEDTLIPDHPNEPEKEKEGKKGRGHTPKRNYYSTCPLNAFKTTAIYSQKRKYQL